MVFDLEPFDRESRHSHAIARMACSLWNGSIIINTGDTDVLLICMAFQNHIVSNLKSSTRKVILKKDYRCQSMGQWDECHAELCIWYHMLTSDLGHKKYPIFSALSQFCASHSPSLWWFSFADNCLWDSCHVQIIHKKLQRHCKLSVKFEGC